MLVEELFDAIWISNFFGGVGKIKIENDAIFLGKGEVFVVDFTND